MRANRWLGVSTEASMRVCSSASVRRTRLALRPRSCVPKREDPHDALISRGDVPLDELPRAAKIGTGSPRRAAQLLRHRPDLEILPLRGNVDTRLRRVADGDFDATLLAVAGLRRLGKRQVIFGIQPPPFVQCIGIRKACRSSEALQMTADDADMRRPNITVISIFSEMQLHSRPVSF